MAATRRSRKRRTHTASATIDNIELTKAGTSLRLEIYARHEKLGTLEVGRGSLWWFGRKRRIRKRLNWTRFADLMDELAYGKE